MKRRVVVTGLGLVTPCGHTVGETWSALMSGRSGVGYIEKFDTEKFSVKIGAEVKGFDPLKFIEKKEARKMGTFIHFAVAAAAALPAITICPGELMFAAEQISPSRAASLQAASTVSMSAPSTAAIAPAPTGTASCM